MFGKFKICGIKYFHFKSKKWKYTTIKDLKVLTVLGYNSGTDLKQWNTGHNLSLIFGQKQKKAFNDICLLFEFGDKYMPMTIYLCGENKVKIPVLCAEGNNFMSLPEYDEETGCLFAYIPPMIFDIKFDNWEHNHSEFDYSKTI
jgi:hypothetical protein